MKVYVITKGDYSDYHICAVALDLAKAEKLAKIFTDSYEDAVVEDFDTEEVAPLLEGRIPYRVTFYRQRATSVSNDIGNPTFTPRVEDYREWAGPLGATMRVYLYAPDEATALKIAQDKRAKYLAEKAGL